MDEHQMTWMDLDTPALLLDLDVLERNIAQMATFARQAGVNLRPHAKTHKSPIIARKQLEAGAIGITCQKLGEAEVMARAGIHGILIANQIVGTIKIGRLVELTRQAAIIVAADDPVNVADLSAAAIAAGMTIGLLVEVDVGMHRCGVQPGEPALGLAREILAAPGLEFRGLMGYEGHAVMIEDADERRQRAGGALQALVDTAELLRAEGIEVEIVSSSGTGTFDTGGTFPGVTELQVGSYATMDGRYRQVGVPFEPALTVLAGVVSTPRPGMAITDTGIKSVTNDFGMPEVWGEPELELKYMSEENGWILMTGERRLSPGDKVRILPSHGCTTINLHDQYYVMRGDEFVENWPVAARGRSQ